MNSVAPAAISVTTTNLDGDHVLESPDSSEVRGMPPTSLKLSD